MKPQVAFPVDIVSESCYSAAGHKAEIWQAPGGRMAPQTYTADSEVTHGGIRD